MKYLLAAGAQVLFRAQAIRPGQVVEIPDSIYATLSSAITDRLSESVAAVDVDLSGHDVPGEGGAFEYDEIVIETGEIAAGGTYSEEVIFVTAVVIDYASLERTAGASDSAKAAIYKGDPGAGGEFFTALLGGEFDGVVVDPIAYGPYVAIAGGTSFPKTVPLPAGTYFIYVAELTSTSAGTFTLKLHHRPAE